MKRVIEANVNHGDDSEETVEPLPKRARRNPSPEPEVSILPSLPPVSAIAVRIDARLKAAATAMHVAYTGAIPGYKRAPSPLFLDHIDHTLLASMRRRFRQDVNTLHPNPRDDRITFDDSIDPATEEERHDYLVIEEEGKPGVKYASVTQCLEHLTKPTNEEFIRQRIDAAKEKPDYVDIYQGCRSAADFGHKRHAACECILLGRELPPSLTTFVPIGFLVFLEDYPSLVPYRVEWRLFNIPAKIAGSLDVLWEGGILADWKNCKFNSFGSQGALREMESSGLLLERRVVEFSKSQPAKVLAGLEPSKRAVSAKHVPPRGVHPLTKAWPECKLLKYLLQLNMYTTMIEDSSPEYTATHGLIHTLLIVNFPPDKPNVYELYRVARLPTMKPFFGLFPWTSTSLVHMTTQPERDFFVPRLEPNDPRGEGPTRLAFMGRDVVLHPQRDSWVGDEWKKAPYDLEPSPFAPPKDMRTYRDSNDEERSLAIRRYEAWLLTNPSKLRMLVPDLFGRTLYCWCRGKEADYCHARVLWRYTNALGQGHLQIREPDPEEGKTQVAIDRWFKPVVS